MIQEIRYKYVVKASKFKTKKRPCHDKSEKLHVQKCPFSFLTRNRVAGHSMRQMRFKISLLQIYLKRFCFPNADIWWNARSMEHFFHLYFTLLKVLCALQVQWNSHSQEDASDIPGHLKQPQVPIFRPFVYDPVFIPDWF